MTKIVEKGIRFRFYPTQEQIVYFAKTFGCCRWVFNEFLELRQLTWKEERRTLNYNECSALLPGLKKENVWLREVSSVCLQQSLRHLEKAYERFFAGKGSYPKRKRRRSKQSATFTQSAFRFQEGKVYLGKCPGALNIRWSRKLPGKPSSLTITRDSADRYYVSMIVREEVSPLPFTTKIVGLDVGLTTLATDQEGNTIPNPRFLRGELKQLKMKQKDFSRKEENSKNREKARKTLAKRHARVQDKRNDYLHKISRQIVNENQVIVVEKLQITELLKNKHLSKAISDVGWNRFLRFLAYKCDWYGREFVEVDRFFPSSKQCSTCGHKKEALPLEVRHWECSHCHAQHDRDVNAAKNLLKEGMRILSEKNEKIPWGSRELKPVEMV